MPTTRWALASISSLLLFAVLSPRALAAGEKFTLVVPARPAPKLDGRLDPAEWAETPVFDIARGEDHYGSGRFLRQGRQLYVAFESTLAPVALGIRFNFQDPVSGRGNMVLVTPLNPPQPPLAAFRQPVQRKPERVSAAGCALRFDFTRKEGFSFELRVPLDLIEFARSEKPYRCSIEVWDLQANRTIGIWPLGAQGLVGGQGQGTLKPDADWGADVDPETGPRPIQPAIKILEEIESERSGTPIGGTEVPHPLRAHLGWSDGHRSDAPLAALQKRLEKLSDANPDFVSLQANLIFVHLGRNDLAGALAIHDGIGKNFPLMTTTQPHFLMRAELLRGLGRFQEAIDDFESRPGYLANNPPAMLELRVLHALLEAQRMEAAIRKEEAQRDDLPRVKLHTSRGDIIVELFEDDAPNAVANFISLVQRGFYDGTRFYWSEGGRRLLGGDPNSMDDDPHNDGFGGPGYMIESEPSRRLNLPYHLAFADIRGTRRTEGSAFVIHIAPFPPLDGIDSVFGRVIKGFDVVRRLEYEDTLEKAVVIRKRRHEYKPVIRPGSRGGSR